MNPSPTTCAASVGALTPEFLASLRNSYVMNTGDRACHNAVSNNRLDALALNQEVARGDDGYFSHRIQAVGVTNQQKSGRCWMFAGLNVLRPQVIRNHSMEEFEFSGAYLQFWDKMEKANLFLESIMELRDAEFLDREWEVVVRETLKDGGWWNYLVGLVEKYGVVPAAAMPETRGGGHTKILNEVLGRLLRKHAVKILDQYADGADVEALRAAKCEALRDVYRLLVINLGQPPADFEWRYRRRNKPDGNEAARSAESHQVADEDLVPLERYTPHSFYQKFVGIPLAEHVCLYNDPRLEPGHHYRFHRARNIVGNESLHFVNIDMPVMKTIAVASILANEPVWFAVDMYVDQSERLGLMQHQLFDFETLFGLDLTVSKADRIRFHAGASCHAMVLMGVDLDHGGHPRKWLVENSWGDKKGRAGRWTLLDKWFDEHVYMVVVHSRHVPGAIMHCFDQKPVTLPAWYPGAEGSH